MLSDQQNLQRPEESSITDSLVVNLGQIPVSFTSVPIKSQIALVTGAIPTWKLCPRGFIGAWISLQFLFVALSLWFLLHYPNCSCNNPFTGAPYEIQILLFLKSCLYLSLHNKCLSTLLSQM